MSVRVIYNAAAFREAIIKPASRIVFSVTRGIARTMRALMKLPKTGRVYKYRGRPHRASAPGQAPAIRSGNLFRSIRESFPNALTGKIEVAAPYAAFLEEGTTSMAPRPFVGPAVKLIREQFKQGGLTSLAN